MATEQYNQLHVSKKAMMMMMLMMTVTKYAVTH
jgi:hypothetical protein